MMSMYYVLVLVLVLEVYSIYILYLLVLEVVYSIQIQTLSILLIICIRFKARTQSRRNWRGIFESMRNFKGKATLCSRSMCIRGTSHARKGLPPGSPVQRWSAHGPPADRLINDITHLGPGSCCAREGLCMPTRMCALLCSPGFMCQPTTCMHAHV